SQAGEVVDNDLGSVRDVTLRQAGRIPGLSYLPDFITSEEEMRLLELVDSMPWSHEYSRRRQHYGQAYYAGQESKIEILPLPGWRVAARQLTCRRRVHTHAQICIMYHHSHCRCRNPGAFPELAAVSRAKVAGRGRGGEAAGEVVGHGECGLEDGYCRARLVV